MEEKEKWYDVKEGGILTKGAERHGIDELVRPMFESIPRRTSLRQNIAKNEIYLVGKV